MIHERHPDVAAHVVAGLLHPGDAPNLGAAARAADNLRGVGGFEPPVWHDLRLGARPPPTRTDDFAFHGRGWQREAAARVEENHRERALLRAQGGAGGGVAFSAIPSCPLMRIDTPLFRVLLLRRLHLPLSPSSRFCRCGRPLDPCGHHRAACARAGVLGRRGFAVESAAARICREAGARVTTNIFVRDLDLGAPIADARRLEVVADGLPQLATTLVSTLKSNGEARRRTADFDGAALEVARRQKERTYPELVGPHSRAKLVVLAGEVAGRCSTETLTFLSKLAKAKSRDQPRLLQRRAEQAWRMHWCAVLSCAAARAFAASLLGLRPVGSDGSTPFSHEVLTSWTRGPGRCHVTSFVVSSVAA